MKSIFPAAIDSEDRTVYHNVWVSYSDDKSLEEVNATDISVTLPVPSPSV